MTVFAKAVQYLESSQGIFPGSSPRKALTVENKEDFCLAHCIHFVVSLETFQPLFTPLKWQCRES